jgi:hypothetical protein
VCLRAPILNETPTNPVRKPRGKPSGHRGRVSSPATSRYDEQYWSDLRPARRNPSILVDSAGLVVYAVGVTKVMTGSIIGQLTDRRWSWQFAAAFFVVHLPERRG